MNIVQGYLECVRGKEDWCGWGFLGKETSNAKNGPGAKNAPGLLK